MGVKRTTLYPSHTNKCFVLFRQRVKDQIARDKAERAEKVRKNRKEITSYYVAYKQALCLPKKGK